MRLPLFSLLYAVCISILMACGGSSDKNDVVSTTTMADESAAPRMMQEAPPPSAAPQIDRKLIRTGSMSIEVGAVKNSREEVSKMVTSMGGNITGDTQTDLGDGISVGLTIRIPSDKFDMLVTSIEGLARRIESKSIRVDDVTAEFVDVEARMKTKYELEARYGEILKTARTVSEILEVERELNNVRAEIESMEGRMKYLKDQVAMSTLELTLTERTSTRSGFWYSVTESVLSGWNGFIGFIFVIVRLWPFILLTAGIIWLYRRWRRNRKTSV